MKKTLSLLAATILAMCALVGFTTSPSSAVTCNGAWGYKYGAETSHYTSNFGQFSYKTWIHTRECVGADQYDEFGVTLVRGNTNCDAPAAGVLLNILVVNPDQFDGANAAAKYFVCTTGRAVYQYSWAPAVTQGIYSSQSAEDRCLEPGWRLKFPPVPDHFGTVGAVCLDGV